MIFGHYRTVIGYQIVFIVKDKFRLFMNTSKTNSKFERTMVSALEEIVFVLFVFLLQKKMDLTFLF